MVFLWAILYGLFYALSEQFAAALGLEIWLTPLFMFGYILLFILWIYKVGLDHKVGLSVPRLHSKSDCIYYLPLIAFALVNLLLAQTSQPSLPDMLLSLCICVAEEIFFRGFLLQFMMKYFNSRGIFAASCLFSLFHLVNLLSGWELKYVLLQVFSAFLAGSYYCLIRYFSGSLLPCVAAHFLTNITSGSTGEVSFCQAVGLILTTPVFICFGTALYKKISAYDVEVY